MPIGSDCNTTGMEQPTVSHSETADSVKPVPNPSIIPISGTEHEQINIPAQADTAAPAGPHAINKPFDPIEALKLGSMRLASIIRNKPAGSAGAESTHEQSPTGDGAVVARIRATAAGLSAKAKEQGNRFYHASISTAASTAEGIKRLALGEPLQALCRSECATHPCPQLVLVACTALVSGGGISTERIFKHNPPPELVDRLALAAGSLSLLPPGASPHAIAALLKRFLLGLPEPLLTYRLLPQWVAAGDHPASSAALLPQLPAANAGTLRLLMQVCAYIHAEAAQNEMDAQALAEVLVPCLAWKPPAKPQGTGGPGPWQGLAKALSLNKGAGAPAAGSEDAAAAYDSGVDSHQQQHQVDDANRVVPLNEAELEAVTTVVEYMISNFSSVFSNSSSSSNGYETQGPA